MNTATTSIAACAGEPCATARKGFNPRTPEMGLQRHAAMSGLLLAVTVLHCMEGDLCTDGLDDAFNLLTMALHDVETLRSWYLYDLAQGHQPTNEGPRHG
jgi:hypothetical protein